ncbi:hypothetical protein TIFTF001_050594 [Ficus carica]|uniref:Uncharacterized protein n=1 Tax=Ficus carica TaxID=3494 RepID=A0AA87Z400_FICCA|nr:hypothetical protein TIFTF001_050594 [Ficus carica]
MRFSLKSIEGDEEDEMRDQSSEFDDNVEDMDIDEEIDPIVQKDPNAHYWNFSNPISYHAMPVTAYDMRLDAMYWGGKNRYGTKWGDG